MEMPSLEPLSFREQCRQAIDRIDTYMDKAKARGSLQKTYTSESKYQTKLLQTFKQLRLQDVMWWTKISDRYIKGVPDILCCVAGKFVFFELKVPGNVASPLQRYNMEKIKEVGGEGCIAINLERPLKIIKSMLETYVTQ